MKIRALVIFLFLLIISSTMAWARAEDDLASGIDLSSLEAATRSLERELGSLAPELDLHTLLDEVRNQGGLNWRAVLEAVGRYLIREITASSRVLGQLLLVVVLTAVLVTIEKSFKATGVARIAEAVLFLAIMGFAIQSFSIALGTGRSAINNMVTFMQAILPVLFTLLVATGAVTTATIFHPFLLGTIAVLGTLTQDVIFPLLYLATILHLVTYLVPEMNVGRLASLIQSICALLLGLVLCAFIGVSAVQGAAAHVADGISIRSAKFLAASFIPVVGKLFADALEAVVGYTLTLKAGVNALGMFLILLLCAFPLLKILTLILVYKLAAALAEPIADARVAKCLSDLGNSMGFVFATVGVVALLFFLALVIILGVGNLATLTR
ncbi:MAG: stage sporulation protein [Bacillota bacterium]|nr:stage sporulation protein [Bacillota bacterium]MDK2926125.1 stage sporulation protein [Bacillota bacterium]MDK2960472.1 stage sporulation protein [Bacillota bacterium]